MSKIDTQRIEAIRARLRASTPGPWRRGDEAHRNDAPFVVVDSTGNSVAACMYEKSDDNAAFIAAAPTDIADLLDEVERLKGIIFKLLIPGVPLVLTPDQEKWAMHAAEQLTKDEP